MSTGEEESIVAIERAMVALRRSLTRRTLHRRAAGEQATPLRAAIFQLLDAVEAGDVAVASDAVDLLNVDQPRASRLVAQAVAEGYLQRGADPADGRRSVLTLTSSGCAALEDGHRLRRDAIAEATFGWSPEDQAAFARLLTAFVAGWGLDVP